MTAALATFAFSGQDVRVITDEHGDPWFVAADVARILGYSSTKDMTRRLDDEDKGGHSLPTLGGEQEHTIISEPGLYVGVLGSQTAGAREFKRWVTRDVLPAIRRTGTYSIAPVPTEINAAMLRQIAEAMEAKDARIAELAPKADLADTYLIAQGGNRKVREAAKLLALRERDLRRFLVDERLIFARHARCGDVQYDFYAEFAHHFQAIEHIVNHTWGSCSHYTLTITPRGIDLVRRRMAKVALPADEAARQLSSAVSA